VACIQIQCSPGGQVERSISSGSFIGLNCDASPSLTDLFRFTSVTYHKRFFNLQSSLYGCIPHRALGSFQRRNSSQEGRRLQGMRCGGKNHVPKATCRTQAGRVTLKGPVRSSEEKAAIEEKASAVARDGKVTSQIEIVPPKS
jgi:hypothetical protein